MALSLILGQAQPTEECMDTTAEVSLDQLGDGYDGRKTWMHGGVLIASVGY